jgi:prepilin-type N-terminal cleavage/methylation domain-containing protein
MANRTKTNQSGFTMVEMLISTVVFVIVLTLAFTTLLAATAVRRAAQARIDIYQNARSTLNVIVQELRSAKLREEDTRFSDQETQAGTINNPNNGRGRFQMVDWPPPKGQAASFGLDPLDKKIYAGNGIDDDGDGSTDEEAYDGLDNDGDGEQQSPMHPTLGVAMADGLDNNDDGRVDEGIDEDIFFPRDMINFLTSRGGEDIEVGYALDTTTGRDLMRRDARVYPSAPPDTKLDGLYPVAVKYEMKEFLPVPNTSPPLFVPWFDSNFESGPDDEGERPRTNSPDPVLSNAQASQPNEESPDLIRVKQLYEVMTLNILGLDFKAYYYDYLIGEENSDLGSPDPLTLIPSLTQKYNPYSFPALSWDSSFENGLPFPQGLLPYPLGAEFPVLPNEPDDLAVIQGTKLFNNHIDNQPERLRLATQHTDGLPRLVEITLFVQDQNRLREDPVRVSTRVLLSFGGGSE